MYKKFTLKEIKQILPFLKEWRKNLPLKLDSNGLVSYYDYKTIEPFPIHIEVRSIMSLMSSDYRFSGSGYEINFKFWDKTFHSSFWTVEECLNKAIEWFDDHDLEIE